MRPVRVMASVVLAVGCAPLLVGCGDEGNVEITVDTEQGPIVMSYTDLEPGTGQEVKKGDTIEALLLGTLSAGRVFVNRQDPSRPWRVKLAEGLEPKGLLWGIPGMKVKGKRKIYVPGELGYGERGMESGNLRIPPNAKLIYEVEVLRIVPPGEPPPRPFDFDD